MICYKVVNISDNKSCYITGSYSREYKVGKTVKARKGTLGIFCFKDIINIIKFCDPSRYKILKVQSIGKAIYPKFLCSKPGSEELKEFYKERSELAEITTQVPDGTICFPSVKVLSEVNDNSRIGGHNNAIYRTTTSSI